MKLEAKNISVSIAGKNIFSNITPLFPEGSCTAIIGPNGAGKSTLLKILAALNTNYEGEIFLGGENIRKLSRKKIARHLAILPQTMQIPPDTTVARLVDFGRFPYRNLFSGGNPKEDIEITEWAISVVKLEKFKDRQVNSLSGGERQRARIAMALAQRPEIILFDEPTTYLDISHQLEVMQLIRLINEKFKMTVITVLHDINHALQYADKVIVLSGGKILQGAPKNIINAEMLVEVFGVEADIFTNSRGASILSPISIIRR
ncbi:MAG: ABC transporter ATP-binding protein [Selenomonadaceae bacterium]|nr:ABC transporter ATP-binding protein [Selenomonadaceae bacterium]